MRRTLPIAFAALLLAYAANAQRAPLYDDAGETREAMQRALAQRQAAAARSERLEAEAEASANEADRTARQIAALAARIQQAEAGIAAAQARSRLVARQQARLQEDLGAEQRPIVSLTAALQQFSRRPIALSLLRPGEIKDVVYLRAIMAQAVPLVAQRTAGLRGRIDRVGQLAREAEQARGVLAQERAALTQRRQDLATLETTQRLAANEAGRVASREAERALALGEQARDLESLVQDLEGAAALRARLAALPGPMLRPGSGSAVSSAREVLPSPQATSDEAPTHYVLPVTGRTLAGFGSPQDGVLSQGVTLGPAANALVVAPADGRVAYAGTYRGYGQIVIVEHAGGWTSLVTGLARSDVTVGQDVVGGTPIGVAGPVRPAITLELRRAGQPVNPLDYLR